MNKSPQSNFSLFAANNTKIPAYGMVRKELNLGLRRPFIWTFIIADVSSPIIGADFLKHFNLLIDLKKKGIIRPSKRVPGVLLFMLCPNLDSTVRPVGDYRQLNSVTEFDSYPMPYLNDFAHALHGKKIFSKIDIFKASHQIPIAECDIPKTAVQQLHGEVHFTKLWTLSYSHWLSFSRKLTSSEKSYSAYDRELLAIYSAIRHFRYMLEARDFTVFTDHKLLTYAFRQKVTSVLHGRSRQLDFISQFTTNIVHIPGSDNIAADVLSRVSAITFPSQIDYDCIAETQQTDQELHTLIASGASLELKKVTFPNSSTEIKCDLSTGTARPYIPKQHRQDVFSAMHNLSHPAYVDQCI
ncbi:transposon Tf2-8 polyprotein [Trichonephila clavipes]|nr:transposon Tf2-8 polyprotein [Trichonephila clavipes]